MKTSVKKIDTILLVDDSDSTNEINKYFLRKVVDCNHIHVAKNGQEALDYFNAVINGKEKKAPDLIFLDINLPVMDGFNFLDEYQKISKNFKNIILILTSSMSKIDREKANQYEVVSGFYNKPLSVDKLQEILGTYF